MNLDENKPTPLLLIDYLPFYYRLRQTVEADVKKLAGGRFVVFWRVEIV
jgi:hypothetical protein